MVQMAVEQQQLDRQQRLNQVLEEKENPMECFRLSTWREFHLPESATSLTFFPSVFAIKPMTEKITKPLIKQVPSLNAVRINVSLDRQCV